MKMILENEILCQCGEFSFIMERRLSTDVTDPRFTADYVTLLIQTLTDQYYAGRRLHT